MKHGKTIRSAGVVGSFTLLSRGLGMMRDVVIAYYFGTSLVASAFFVAFTIPNLFRRFVADEGLTGALVPAIAQAETAEGTEQAQTLANRILTALLLLNAGIISLGMVAPELLVWMSASGFAENPEKFALTVSMTRWMMPFLGMVSLVSFFEGLLNHRGHFFMPKIAPGLVSAGMSASAVLLSGWFENPAWAVVVGVWIGGAVHVLVHLPIVWSKWGPVRLMVGFGEPRVRRVLKELSKVVAIGVFAQLNILVLRTLASFMGDGAVTRYMYSTRLVDLAQGAIAVAIGSALLPNIAQAVAAEDWDRFYADLVGAFRLAGFLLIPAAAGLFVFAVPLTSMVFLSTRYTWLDVMWTASALQLLTPFMLSVAGINIVKKVYFAMDERNVLLGVGGLGVGLTGLIGWLLLDQNILGLAVALSSATVAQLVIYVAVLKWQLKEHMPVGPIFAPYAQIAAASVPMSIFAYWAASRGQWILGRTPDNIFWFVVGIGGAIVLYGIAAWILGIDEFTKVSSRLLRRFGR